jgi:hypothetical protein
MRDGLTYIRLVSCWKKECRLLGDISMVDLGRLTGVAIDPDSVAVSSHHTTNLWFRGLKLWFEAMQSAANTLCVRC